MFIHNNYLPAGNNYCVKMSQQSTWTPGSPPLVNVKTYTCIDGHGPHTILKLTTRNNYLTDQFVYACMCSMVDKIDITCST